MRSTDPFGDENRSPMMNPHNLNSYNNRTPSPGRPLDTYQLQDNPYGPSGHLPMPSSDRLADQPTVSDVHAEGEILATELTTLGLTVFRRQHP